MFPVLAPEGVPYIVGILLWVSFLTAIVAWEFSRPLPRNLTELTSVNRKLTAIGLGAFFGGIIAVLIMFDRDHRIQFAVVLVYALYIVGLIVFIRPERNWNTDTR
jgi:hypothetical protein